MSAPYATAYDTSSDTADTLRLPQPTENVPDHRPTGPVLDAPRLWTGGLATAVVAALVALVGTLVVQVLFRIAPVSTLTTHTADTGMLCLLAAAAALAATGVAHLLLVSTPNPLGYLGWIIGLSTAAAVVLPLIGTLPIAAAAATGVVHLVIGLAIGSLVVGTAATVRRPTTW